MSHDFGQLIAPGIPLQGGDADLFERGLKIRFGARTLEAKFAFPMIGRPSIVFHEPEASPLFEARAVHYEAADPADAVILGTLIREALRGRLGLVETGSLANPIVLDTGAPSELGSGIFGLNFDAPTLQERQLYDVAVATPQGWWQVIAPHAVYYRRSWQDFGFAHVTDIHVSKRIDRFRGYLEIEGRTAAAQKLINWNDRFRGFVKYANFLHSQGLLDVILSTGDQYDYMFEDGDDPALGGNAAFFRALNLGQAPGPDFPKVEELRVPIFVTGGNHDYRKFAYRLCFDLNIGTGDLGLPNVINKDVKRIEQFSGLGIGLQEALAIDTRLHPRPAVVNMTGFFDGVPSLNTEAAARMVEVDPNITPHKLHLSDRLSYTAKLGPHRIAMLDSGADVGIATAIGTGLIIKLGFGSENQDTFFSGSPNSEGVSAADLDEVRKAIRETPAEGLVVVGIHAPLLNPIDEEYPYFLRQTQRPVHPNQVDAFLRRRTFVPGKLSNLHPTWYPGPHDHRPPAFVKRIDTSDFLDFAVSRGKAKELIEALVGKDGRAADLVLSRHTHNHNEFIVRREQAEELAFFMDFYTQNPANYYATRFATDHQRADSGFAGPVKTDTTSLEIQPGADPAAKPHKTAGGREPFHLQIPPYPNPLNDTSDPRAWWNLHRPLLLQTTALGPYKSLQYFSGFRVFLVRNNIIEKAHFISSQRLEANNYQMPFEDAIKPEAPYSPPRLAAWASVIEGATLPGARVTALARAGNIALFLADPGGGVYASSGSRAKGFGKWQTASHGSTKPGAPITAIEFRGKAALFLADPGGQVFATTGSFEGGWAQWTTVSQGACTPGGAVTAVVNGNRINVFLADPGGGVFANSGQPPTSWMGWNTVKHGSTMPGAPIAAIAKNGKVILVLANQGGQILTTIGVVETQVWNNWTHIPGAVTAPGGVVTALDTGTGIQLFLVNQGGAVMTCQGSYQGVFGGWVSLSDGASAPGAPVTAVRAAGRTHVFIADPSGEVFTAHSKAGGFSTWTTVAEGKTAPGGFVTATVTGSGSAPKITVFLSDPHGGVFSIDV